jgi:hypothetical protein
MPASATHTILNNDLAIVHSFLFALEPLAG